jgi:CRISPR system Cascade subunit CasC
MFLQVHTLTSYPASLLNRDDAGLAKRIPFGDATRLRVSSQCLKRHWRENLQTNLPDLPDGLRTRQFFPRAVLPRLTSAGVPDEKANALCETMVAALIVGGSKGLDMSQPVLFGAPEADYVVKLALEAHAAEADTKAAAELLKKMLTDKDMKKNLAAMSKSAAGLTAAMFGRFVTSDILARVDAPVHVAHAFTVHAAQTEMDYFTVVDDLNRDDEAGAAHAGDAELGAGLYYGYVAVDVPLLVSNLSGCEAVKWREQDASAARQVLTSLIRAIAEQSPGAKLGATAPYSRAELVLLEAGRSQPRTLANAFLKALKSRPDPMQPDPMQQAADRIAEQIAQIDGMYGATADLRALATIKDAARFAPVPPQPLAAATAAALDAVFGA